MRRRRRTVEAKLGTVTVGQRGREEKTPGMSFRRERQRNLGQKEGEKMYLLGRWLHWFNSLAVFLRTDILGRGQKPVALPKSF